MTNLNHFAVSLEDNLARSIRGYHGYQIRQARSQTDESLRGFLLEKLKQIEQDFTKLGHLIQKCQHHTCFETFDRIALSLKVLIQSLTNPSYNHTHFFTQDMPSRSRLSQLLEHDAQLVNQVEILVDEMKDLNHINGEHDAKDILNHLFDLVDGINQTLSEREFILLGESE